DGAVVWWPAGRPDDAPGDDAAAREREAHAGAGAGGDLDPGELVDARVPRVIGGDVVMTRRDAEHEPSLAIADHGVRAERRALQVGVRHGRPGHRRSAGERPDRYRLDDGTLD